MEFFISAGVSWLLEAIADKKNVVKYADKFAKVFVAIDRVAQTNVTLAGAIERQRQKS